MPDKPQFVRELVRVLAPKGRVLLATWCHRELLEGESSLGSTEKDLLSNINQG